ncbi:MAG TPA: lauroyl acyltransferase [Hyphomicrobiales bacterium]|nr:lauroyl acyltransferase [Hyphomicrobiales bacterium]
MSASPATPDPDAPDAPRRLAVRLRHRLEYGLFRALEGLVRLLGPDRASALSGRLWRLAAPRTRRHARALENLARAFPEMDAAQRERIARAMWENLGRVMAEGLLIDRIIDEGRVQPGATGLAILAEARGRGVYASMHYGNWELTAWPLTAGGCRTAGIYRPLDNPLLDARIAALRHRIYVDGLFGKGEGSPRRLFTHARAGHPIVMLADLREMRGIAVPFFGHAAPSTPLPAMVARSLDLPLVAARTVREGGVRFRVEAEPVPVPRTADRDADIMAATAALHAVFERWIREDPAQWMWAHRRWDPSPTPGRWRRRR